MLLVVLVVAGLPSLQFHDLGHTAANQALIQCVQLRVISDMLGHSSVGLTLNTYSHLLPSMRQSSAAAMDAILVADAVA